MRVVPTRSTGLFRRHMWHATKHHTLPQVGDTLSVRGLVGQPTHQTRQRVRLA